MNIDQFQERIFAAARAIPMDERVPYTFEKRVMAALAERRTIDPIAFWGRLLWRAAAPCVGIMLVLSAWTVMSNRSVGTTATLAADLERTVWGPLTSLNDSW